MLLELSAGISSGPNSISPSTFLYYRPGVRARAAAAKPRKHTLARYPRTENTTHSRYTHTHTQLARLASRLFVASAPQIHKNHLPVHTQTHTHSNRAHIIMHTNTQAPHTHIQRETDRSRQQRVCSCDVASRAHCAVFLCERV